MAFFDSKGEGPQMTLLEFLLESYNAKFTLGAVAEISRLRDILQALRARTALSPLPWGR